MTTVSAPMTGNANLVKKGAGRLLLNAEGNVLDTLTIEGGSVTIGPDLRSAAQDKSVEFLTVRTLVGEIAAPGGFSIKTALNKDGTRTFSARAERGAVLIIR